MELIIDYLSLYKSIIKKAKREHKIRLYNKKHKLEYYEKHHSIPKCLIKHKPRFQTYSKNSHKNLMNKSWNTVLLTSKEHFVSHHLLTKITIDKRNHQKLCKAFSAFFMGHGNLKITSNIFSVNRKELASISSESMRGSNNPMYGRNFSEIQRNNMSQAKVGIKKSLDTIKKQRNSKLGNKNHKRIPHMYIITKITGERFTITNLKQWSKENGYGYHSLYYVAVGKNDHHKDIIKIEKL